MAKDTGEDQADLQEAGPEPDNSAQDSASQSGRTGFVVTPYETTQPVYHLEDETARPDTFQLARVPKDSLALFVSGYEAPVIAKGSQQLILGRRAPGVPSPSVDLLNYGAAEKGVSRQHAMIMLTRGSYFLQDLGSTNGTWLNGNRLLPYRAHELNPGDQIRLGQLKLHIYFHAAPTAGTAQVITLKVDQLSGAPPSEPVLTPEYLHGEVLPYLAAIVEIQRLVDEILGRSPSEVLIKSIGYPFITVDLINTAQAIELIAAEVLPWRDAYVSDIAKVMRDQEKPEAVDGPQKPGLFGIGRRAKPDTKPLIEKLEQAQTHLALEIIARVNPDLPEETRDAFAQRMLLHIKALTFSNLVLSAD
jgi:pSer/pThr/pTyr-binding forkhead associated (FHA) protein